jgi:hypothetical protein
LAATYIDYVHNEAVDIAADSADTVDPAENAAEYNHSIDNCLLVRYYLPDIAVAVDTADYMSAAVSAEQIAVAVESADSARVKALSDERSYYLKC